MFSKSLTFNKRLYFCIIFIFIFFFAIFYLIQFSSENLGDPDAFYHIKYSYLLRTEGLKILNNFPWMQYSVLSQRPADFAFFYHILLLPFTYFNNLIFGIKLSSVIFSSLFFAVFYFVLQKLKIKYPFFWTILLFAMSGDFVFRLILPRDFILSMIFAILGIYFIIEKKYFWLFIVSFLYALSYPASFIIIIFALIYMAIERFKKIKNLNNKHNWQLLFASILGVMLGLIIRPDFPNNLYINFVQIFSVFYYKFFGPFLNVGAELYPIKLSITSNLILIILFDLSAALFLIDVLSKKSIEIKRLYLFWLAVAFLILTLIAQRFIEYWAPLTVLFAAVSLSSLRLTQFNVIARSDLPTGGERRSNPIYITERLLRSFQSLAMTFCKSKIFFFFAFSCLFILLGWLLSFNILKAQAQLSEGFSPQKYRDASSWLKENTKEKEIIFHTSWDQFPMLFFHNSENYYLVGMDPTFMYVHNPKKYWLWRNLTEKGIICETEIKNCPTQSFSENFSQRRKKIVPLLENKFKTNYVFIDKQKVSKSFWQIFNNTEITDFKKIKLIYEDKLTQIFQTE